MSWLDNLQNVRFSITTGDGIEYFPFWIKGERTKEFNVTKYDFINVQGSLIDRKQAKGSVFPLKFYFQGEDNIEQSQRFEESANDNRFWIINHPFYGRIQGHPMNLKRNDMSYNATEVTVDFWETISGQFPMNSISINDEVITRVNQLNMSTQVLFLENAEPSVSDIPVVRESIMSTSSFFNPDGANFNEFRNISTRAIRSVDSLVLSPLVYYDNLQQTINAPANFATSVSNRLDSYERAYNNLKNNISNLFSRYNFESQAADMIAAMAQTVITPQENDYITRSDIEAANTRFINIYFDYLSTLDDNQVDIYQIGETYAPHSRIQSELMNLVLFTSESLFVLSFDARQERFYELKEDSNIILLTHRFIGLDPDDENLETFKSLNDVKGLDNFMLRKGRTIRYFV